jgi:Rieske Fe-S protein
VKENSDYPYYMLRDHLQAPPDAEVQELTPGSGCVVKRNGKKVAAYRAPNGNVTYRSAVCTHMGCIVHWNNAENTWDCPCHGSRFAATGEVIGGPAESSLANVD